MSYTLYKETAPYEKGLFPVGDGHELYYERFGNKNGIPIIYLHGGPGAGCSFSEYCLFNLDYCNVLLFDQRGAGKSVPYAETKNNSIDKLVEDIETFLQHIGVDQWTICGGSWGSALGMFYATKYPQYVEQMLLNGIFFADQTGAQHIIEENGSAKENLNKYFEAYRDYIPKTERKDGLMLPYYKRLMSPDIDQSVEAARLFDMWDTSIISYSVSYTHLTLPTICSV